MTTDPATDERRWRLEATLKKEIVHTSTCHGDQALDAVMKGLERRYKGVRITVRPA